jgi:hypothetical protein
VAEVPSGLSLTPFKENKKKYLSHDWISGTYGCIIILQFCAESLPPKVLSGEINSCYLGTDLPLKTVSNSNIAEVSSGI